MLDSLSIRLKLLLLAGVPVLGAMALASLLWTQAQQSAKSAAALGSVEDFANLSTQISSLVHQLQAESALVGVVLGHLDRINEEIDPDAVQAAKSSALAARVTLREQYSKTNAAKERLYAFLSTRNLTALPGHLRRDLKLANRKLSELGDLRSDTRGEKYRVPEAIEFFASTNRALIDATASLTTLSDDGQLLRKISALVSVMQVKERASQEQALLSAAFAANRYPPGTYRALVRLTTQAEDYIKMLRTSASDSQIAAYDESLKAPVVVAAAAMHKKAMETIDEDFDIDVDDWFNTQAAKIAILRSLEAKMTAEVRVAAMAKVSDTERSIRTSLGLSAAVLAISSLLGWLIARSVNASVRSLSAATASVQKDKNFSIRATKTSNDELGDLTDAFNAMLTDIQKRDGELSEYRHTLEDKVKQRTAALSSRNEAMRVVLNNVEQGLATIKADGTLDSERSAVFDAWFGAPANDVSLGAHLCGNDKEAAAMLDIGWADVMEGFLPTELSIHQMPSNLQVGARHYSLAYRVTKEKDAVTGALLVVTDVTDEVTHRAEELRQREFNAIFERVMKDRNGFIEFFNETEKVVTCILSREMDRKLLMRDIHTVKGNCAIFGVFSVAAACGAVENAVEEKRSYPTEHEVKILENAWQGFSERVRALVGEDIDQIIEVSHDELDEIIAAVRRLTPHGELSTQLQRLKYEPIEARFARIAEQATSLARKLGKPVPTIVIESNDLRFPAVRWAGFWSAFSHVVRNAVDHGLETPEQRQGRKKKGPGRLRLSARRSAGRYVVEIQDDGNGIDWEKLRAKANDAGLPSFTQEDLVEALFADGVSSRDTVSDTSGRGVGLGAVLQATTEMKGIVTAESTFGQGTILRFQFPLSVGDLIGFRSDAPGARPSLGPPPSSKQFAKPA